MTGWILKTDGTVESVSDKLHQQQQGGSLKALYAALGCHIVERVVAPWGEFWCDEEGMFKQPPIVNEFATQIYWETFPHVQGQPLMGDVFIRVKTSCTKGKRLTEVLEIRAANP